MIPERIIFVSRGITVHNSPVIFQYLSTEISQTSKLEFIRETVFALNLFVYFTNVTFHDFQEMAHDLQIRFFFYVNLIFEQLFSSSVDMTVNFIAFRFPL